MSQGSMCTSFRSSQVRPFRLAGTLTAVQLISSRVGVLRQLQDAVTQAQFQLEAEGKKKNANKVCAHLQQRAATAPMQVYR